MKILVITEPQTIKYLSSVHPDLIQEIDLSDEKLEEMANELYPDLGAWYNGYAREDFLKYVKAFRDNFLTK